MTYAVECKYRRKDVPEIIALFDREIDSHRYVIRHNGEGRCILNVIKLDIFIEYFSYVVEHIYDKYKPRALFRYECEAQAYVSHHAHWNEGYFVTVKQPLLQAVT